MKRLFAGCLIIALIGGAVLAGGAWFLYRAAAPYIADARRSWSEETSSSPTSEASAEVPYLPPASNELTENQVERFVRVQDFMLRSLGERREALVAKYKQLGSGAQSVTPDWLRELVSGAGDFAGVVAEARTFQRQALAQEKLSRQEYSWIRGRVFEAAGYEAISGIDLSSVETLIRQGIGSDTTLRLPKPDVPQKNRDLVRPYLDRFDHWTPLAVFGL